MGDEKTVSLTSKGSSKTEKDRFETDDNSAEITRNMRMTRLHKAKEIALTQRKIK